MTIFNFSVTNFVKDITLIVIPDNVQLRQQHSKVQPVKENTFNLVLLKRYDRESFC